MTAQSTGNADVVAIDIVDLVLGEVARDGRAGSNRAPRAGCQLAANTDVDAIRAWLGEYAASPHTLRAYRKEAERLLVWCTRALGKPISSRPCNSPAVRMNTEEFV